MKLGTKIILGFSTLLAVAVILGVVAIIQMRGVQEKSNILAKEYIPEVKDMTGITKNVFGIRLQVLGIVLSGEEKYVTGAREGYTTLSQALKEFKDFVEASPHLIKGRSAAGVLKEKSEKYWELAQSMAKIREEWRTSPKLQIAAGKRIKEHSDRLIDLFRKELDGVAPTNAAAQKIALEKMVLAYRLQEIGLTIRMDGAASVRDKDIERLQGTIKTNFPVIENATKALREKTAGNAEAAESLKEIDAAAVEYKALLESYLQSWKLLDGQLAEAVKVGGELVDKTIETSDAASDGTTKMAEETDAALNSASLVLIIGLLIAIALGITLAIVITRGITGPVNRIISSLNDAGEQVAAASGQISSASQSLAEGATEQAASLEESSSALEEMASMTRQNADNAVNANQMMSQTQSQVSNGAEAVRNMARAMGEINDSSEQISRIIKTIEEIAFQTNLLALNAAVEAARAGDAGKGFAVVADEVRNLAQRSAQAARDTADLIESTVARVKNGTEIVGELQKSFVEVENAANGVAGLINEISAASNEQAQGVDQVNTAVAQMDKVTQTNAANAEESASAAEELNAQAEQLRSLVSELVKIVRGKDAQAGETHLRPHMTHQLAHHSAAPMRSPRKSLSLSHSSPASSAGAGKKLGGGSAEAGAKGPNVVKPNQVIPLDDDDDFSDF